MRDEEFSINEVDVGFDAAEAIIERVEERALVFVIIVGVSSAQWDRRFLRLPRLVGDASG